MARWFLFAVFVFGSSYLSAATLGNVNTLPGKVYIIRGGESDNGKSLNLQGLARAHAMSTLFSDVTAFFCFPGDTLTSQTLAPLAKARGLPVQSTDDPPLAIFLKLVSPYGPQDVVMISWPYNRIAALGAALTNNLVHVPDYPPDRFDLVYMFNFLPEESPFCVALEELMFGDPTTLPPGFPSCH